MVRLPQQSGLKEVDRDQPLLAHRRSKQQGALGQVSGCKWAKLRTLASHCMQYGDEEVTGPVRALLIAVDRNAREQRDRIARGIHPEVLEVPDERAGQVRVAIANETPQACCRPR